MPKDLKYRNGQGCYTHRTSLQIGERTKRQGARQTEKSRCVDAAQLVYLLPMLDFTPVNSLISFFPYGFFRLIARNDS